MSHMRNNRRQAAEVPGIGTNFTHIVRSAWSFPLAHPSFLGLSKDTGEEKQQQVNRLLHIVSAQQPLWAAAGVLSILLAPVS